MQTTPLETWISEKIGDAGGRLDRTRLERYQLIELRKTIALAKSAGLFYRERLAGLSEGDLSELKDLSRFPFTTAADIQRSPLRFLCVSQSEIERVVTLHTSGTTAEPKRVFFTTGDQELTVDFFHRGMATLAGPGDRVLVLLPWELPGSVGDLLLTGLHRLRALGIGVGFVRDISSALAVVIRERPDVLVGVPTQVLSLARCGEEMAPPRSVLLSTDHVPDAIVSELECRWGCRVYNHYGMTEMGFGGGLECDAHLGYHMREADLFFEIVDPLTGESVREGETGEVVFTTLTRRGMPLIRYRTGDMSRFLPEPCPCGTSLKTLAQIRDRIQERFRVPGGGLLTMADLDEAMFKITGLLNFRATLTREKEVDCLIVEAAAIGGWKEGITSEISDALQAMPSVALAAATGRFSVVVSVGESSGERQIGSAKRTIEDRRDRKPIQ